MQDFKKKYFEVMNYTFLFQIFLYPEVLENFSLSEIMKLLLILEIILAQYHGLELGQYWPWLS